MSDATEVNLETHGKWLDDGIRDIWRRLLLHLVGVGAFGDSVSTFSLSRHKTLTLRITEFESISADFCACSANNCISK